MPQNSKKKTTAQPRLKRIVLKPLVALKKKIIAQRERNPHHSFMLTKRRDYRRALVLPGLFSFTRQVNRTVWKYRKTFILLVAVYAVLSFILVGIGSQDIYGALTSTLHDTGSEIFQGNFGQIGQAGLLLLSIGTTGLSGTLSETQQIFSVLLILMVWLSTVWLLRNLMAGHKVKMRDGLYNSSAPIISSALVAVVFVLQLLPIGIAIVAYSSALSTGLLSGGVASMLFWMAATLLVVLSLYWITSTFFALIIVTLPGMYPMRALKVAGEMVLGRRVRILGRLLWMGLAVVVSWAIIMIPVILLDTWLKGVWPQTDWVPTIPFALLIMSSLTVAWVASYVYLLYRKVVDDDALPA